MAGQTKGQKMAEQLTDFINSASIKDRNDFVNAMMGEHRTLQEETFKLFLATCNAWAEMYRLGNYDGRNQFTVTMSSHIANMRV